MKPRRPLQVMTDLARSLRERRALDELLQLIVDGAAELLDAARVSIRLLDPAAEKLIAVCRAGVPAHMDMAEEFRVGEGLIGWIAAHKQAIRTADARSDPRFVHKGAGDESVGSFLGVPLVVGQVALGVLGALHPDRDHFTEEHEELVTLLAGVSAPYVENARLARLANVDPLTGALNRRGMAQTAVPADERREQEPEYSVALVDIDHFKQVNDRWGHGAGDMVLQQVARRLGTMVREGDALVRYGGEEFVLILSGVGLEAATAVAERARLNVEATAVTIGEVTVRVTISIGVAQHQAGEPRDEVIARADAAMYLAKQEGRNCVRSAS